jgi:hypothetical protein
LLFEYQLIVILVNPNFEYYNHLSPPMAVL